MTLPIAEARISSTVRHPPKRSVVQLTRARRFELPSLPNNPTNLLRGFPNSYGTVEGAAAGRRCLSQCFDLSRRSSQIHA